MTYLAVATFVILGIVFIALGLYVIGSILVLCGIALYLADKAATPEYTALYIPSLIPSTTDKLVEHDTECTQPKLPV